MGLMMALRPADHEERRVPPSADVSGVIAGFDAQGNESLATWVRRANT
jgi:hypothetical protein